jgi:hypothetical protein
MVPPPFIITMALTTLITWALVTLAVPLVVYITLTLSSKSGIALAALVTAISAICILRTTLVLMVQLGRWSAVIRVLRRLGLGKLIRSGGKEFSSKEIYPMVVMSLNGYHLIHLDGSMDEDIHDRIRGDK